MWGKIIYLKQNLLKMNKILSLLIFFFNLFLMDLLFANSAEASPFEKSANFDDSQVWNDLFHFDFEADSLLCWQGLSHWEISDLSPISGNYSFKHLKLDGEKKSSVSFLIPSVDATESELFFSFKLKNGNWDPSSSNKFYMTLLHKDAAGEYGYAIGVNAKGSSDMVSIWTYKNGSLGDVVAQTAFDWNVNTSAQIDLQRSPDGTWTLKCTDLLSWEQFSTSGFDVTYNHFDFVGFVFAYTATRSGQLWIDDWIGRREILGPRVKSVHFETPTSFEVEFSKQLKTDLLKASSFKLVDSYFNSVKIKNVNFLSDSLAMVEIDKVENLFLTLSVSKLFGIDGTQTDTSSFSFIYRLPISQSDVLINEVLFDPKVGASDFVELYNNSDYLLDLSMLNFATRSDSFTLKTVSPIFEVPEAFYPHEYLAFTTKYDGVADFYHVPCSNCLIEIPKMPVFPNDKGTVVLLNDSMFIVDEFSYTAKMHNIMISDPDGISLERISIERSTADPLNWQSASSAVGFATPGYENSQTDQILSEDLIIKEDVISPNDDGFNDELEIKLILPYSACMASISIFDLSGRKCVSLLENQLVGQQSIFIFSGQASSGQFLPSGAYVVVAEAFHPKGYQFRQKRAFAIYRN